MQGDIAQITAALGRIGAETSDFDLNPKVDRVRRDLRAAAVLVPIVATDAGLQVVLTKRASHLAHHPGQIAFPGGKVDAQDAGPADAALREAREEIGLDRASVRILGTLPDHETVTGYRMTPVVGFIPEMPRFAPDPAEVAEVFAVPLTFLRHLPNFRVESRNWQGQPRHYYTVPYGPYYIWGATARVLFAFAMGLRP